MSESEKQIVRVDQKNKTQQYSDFMKPTLHINKHVD